MATSGEQSISRRSLLRLALAVPVVPGLVALPTLSTAAEPRPLAPRIQRLPLDETALGHAGPEAYGDGPDGGGREHGLATAEIETERFSLAAFTWTGGASEATLRIRARSRADHGWSDWVALHDDGHGPDPGSAEDAEARRGTDLAIMGDSDAVEVRIESADGAVPRDLKIELIDPGESPVGATVDTYDGGMANADVARPAIRTRADWGADESIREQTQPSYGAIRGGFVHHTAGGNNYSQSDVPGIIRGIYAYHVNGRGWRDIGYNFLIDRFGRIWEGRYGGVTRAVVGAHTQGYNSNAFAASVLGTYTSKTPESAVLNAYATLFAWKFGLHGVDPSARVAYPNQKTLPAISGHRDGGTTECPGERLYARLDTIRSRTRDAMRSLSSELTLTAHTSTARAGKRIWFDVDWRAGTRRVDGTVVLQRRSGNSWATVNRAAVRNGTGAVSASPPADRTYRLLSGESTSPLGVAATTSSTLAIAAVRSSSELTMSRAGATRSNGEVPIDIEWRHGSSRVTGRVALQYYRSGSWRHARYADVDGGAGTTVLRPSRSQAYRLRAVSTAGPSGVDTSHPAGTSNEFRVVVS